MTIDKFNIKSVAIIGGGPGGLTTLNELLNTTADGKTSVHTDSRPQKPAFENVVLFEQKDRAGGVWATDVDTADSIPEEIIKSKEYYKPDVIQPNIAPPNGLNETFRADNPLMTEAANNELQWRRSGVYPGLFSNVPRRFLRFSTVKYNPKEHSKKLDPLVRYQEITDTLNGFVKDKRLADNIRFNTQVQIVNKDPKTNKWKLTLRRTNKELHKDEWYTESFDAVVVASGHYSVPYIPYVEGLETRDPSSIIHAKSFRNANDFKDQRVLVVGSSLSGIDIVQYINSVAKDVYISRTPGKQEIFPWLTRAANSLKQKPKISKIQGTTVEFQDGSILENIDKIIYSTGYHWNYQFLSDESFKKTLNGFNNAPTSSSRIHGLYYDTFNIEDPTIGFVGIGLTPVKFHTLETSAAALAGIWSNAKELPSKQEQYKWEQRRLKETADNSVFHYYTWDTVKEQWVDKLIKFAPEGRRNPLKDEDLSDFTKGYAKVEEIFLDLKENKGHFDHF